MSKQSIWFMWIKLTLVVGKLLVALGLKKLASQVLDYTFKQNLNLFLFKLKQDGYIPQDKGSDV